MSLIDLMIADAITEDDVKTKIDKVKYHLDQLVILDCIDRQEAEVKLQLYKIINISLAQTPFFGEF
jgi:hypothetical protein